MKYTFELFSSTLPKWQDGDEFTLCNFGREVETKILPDDFKGTVTFRRCNLNFCVIDPKRMIVDDCLTGNHPVIHPPLPDVVQRGIDDAGGVDAVLAKIGVDVIKAKLNLVDAPPAAEPIGEMEP